jgi:hypothetical protein
VPPSSHKNEEVEIYILEQLPTQEPNFNHRTILNLYKDRKNASMCLGDYAEQEVQFRAIHDNT